MRLVGMEANSLESTLRSVIRLLSVLGFGKRIMLPSLSKSEVVPCYNKAYKMLHNCSTCFQRRYRIRLARGGYAFHSFQARQDLFQCWRTTKKGILHGVQLMKVFQTTVRLSTVVIHVA